MLEVNRIYAQDCLDGLRLLDDESVNCCVTSPPYWHVRDYGVPPTNWPAVTFSPMAGLPPVTAPGWTGCLGLEPDPLLFTAHIIHVFREVRRVLRRDGTCWVNFGDSYCTTAPGTMGDNINIDGAKEATRRARKIMRPDTPTGLKVKDLVGIPWRVAFALQADGWWLRNDNIWAKKNTMPESVTDRCAKSHEYLFLFSKSRKYYFDHKAIMEPCVWEGINGTTNGVGFGHGTDKEARGRERIKADPVKYTDKKMAGGAEGIEDRKDGYLMRNKRDVWFLSTAICKEEHFATYPPALVEPCILAGCPPGGLVLDPFMGSGTTAQVAAELQRNYIGFDINPAYVELANNKRLASVQLRLIERPEYGDELNNTEGNINERGNIQQTPGAHADGDG